MGSGADGVGVGVAEVVALFGSGLAEGATVASGATGATVDHDGVGVAVRTV